MRIEKNSITVLPASLHDPNVEVESGAKYIVIPDGMYETIVPTFMPLIAEHFTNLGQQEKNHVR